MPKECSTRRVFSRILRKILRSEHPNTTTSKTTSIIDIDIEPLSPSGTLVEKADRMLPPYARGEGTCSCAGAWQYPTDLPASTMNHLNALSPSPTADELLSPEIVATINATIDKLDPSLRELSLDIWDHPEVGYQEKYTHDALTSYMSGQGFTIEQGYLGLDTAWRAEYSRGKGGRVIGINSEMDALPGLGHACGHNLIAVSGIAVAVALKAAIDKHNVSAKIVLLGTPAEEFGGGKIRLYERGAYEGMDVCVMSHPGPGKPSSALISPWMALQNVEVEFIGHSAHAAFSPWEANNALDAAFIAYSGVSVLRQQMKPTSRVHGIIMGKEWEPNVIPDYAKMRWIVRAPTFAEVESLCKRVEACFQAAGIATSCKVNMENGVAYHDVRQSTVLGDEYCRIVETHLGMVTSVSTTEAISASSDFGLISYNIPSIQPVFSVPTQPKGSNHTPQFAQSARSPEAHEACMKASKGLAMTAFRVADDEGFYLRVKQDFEAIKRLNEITEDVPQGAKA